MFCLSVSEGLLRADALAGWKCAAAGPPWQRSQGKDANHAQHVLGDSDLIFRDELRLLPSKVFTNKGSLVAIGRNLWRQTLILGVVWMVMITNGDSL